MRILEVMTTLDCAADSLSSQTVPKFAGSRLTPRAAQKYHQLLLPAVGRAYCPPTAASTAKQLFEQVTLPDYLKERWVNCEESFRDEKFHLIIFVSVSAILPSPATKRKMGRGVHRCENCM